MIVSPGDWVRDWTADGLHRYHSADAILILSRYSKEPIIHDGEWHATLERADGWFEHIYTRRMIDV